MLRFFQDGGFGMLPTAAFGLLLVAVAIAYALDPDRKLVTVYGILAAVVMLSGALGATLGFIATFMFVSKLPVDQQFGVTLLGSAESLNNLALALALLVVSTLILAAGTLRSALRRGRETD